MNHNPESRAERTRDWLQQGVLPVVVINSVKQGLEIAEGLCAGGRRATAAERAEEIVEHRPVAEQVARIGQIRLPRQPVGWGRRHPEQRPLIG